MQADSPDGGEHHFADHLVVVGLHAAESDDQTTLADRTAAPLRPATLIEVGSFLLDVLSREPGLPAGKCLLYGDDAEGGIPPSAILPRLLEEDDVRVERRVCLVPDILVLGLPWYRGVQYEQVTLLAFERAVLHGCFDRRTDDLECLIAQLSC